MSYNPESRGGGKGWVALSAFVIGYDLLAQETLSNAFARGREHDNPIIRATTLGALAVTACHLLDLIPEQRDPIDQLSRVLGRGIERVRNVI